MKKITLTLIGLLYFSFGFSQTYTTGLLNLSSEAGLEFSIQIDVNSTTTTLTMIGPENRWLGIGFGVQGMTAGEDVVIFDGARLTDRYYGFPGQTPGDDATGIVPTEDAEGERDWTVVSNVVNSGVRTLVSTRATDTGNPNDYVFSASTTSIELAWARARFEGFDLEWHGTDNRGVTMQGLTLSTQDVNAQNEFEISPNPATSKLNIKLAQTLENANVTVYNVLGKKVYAKTLSAMTSSIDVSKWNTGVYLVRISADNQTITKRFVKQ